MYIIPRTSNNYFPLQHYPTGLHSIDGLQEVSGFRRAAVNVFVLVGRHAT